MALRNRNEIERSRPRISVICATYNGETFLQETIDSLAAQQEGRFEAIFVDDCSTDSTREILAKVSDPRFRYLANDVNRRVVYTRNRAIEQSVAQYIAITDQDDISYPKRLKAQSTILDRYPEVSAVYSFVKPIDELGNRTRGLPNWHYSGQQARAALLFHNFVSHSSLMFRRQISPESVYHIDYPLCEDYKLLVHLADQGQGLYLIKKQLVGYRFHSSNNTKSTAKAMSELSRRLRTELLKRIDVRPNEYEMSLHDFFESGVKEPTLSAFRDLREWVFYVRESNRRCRYVKPTEFDAVLTREWLSVSHQFAHLGKDAWRVFSRNAFIDWSTIGESLLDFANLWRKTHNLSAMRAR